MQGIELVKSLAELDREFVRKLDEAHQTADGRIAGAQEKTRRILNEAEIQMRQMEEDAKARITEEGEKLAQEARARAEAETERIRRQAAPRIERAVSFLLSEVLP